MTKGRLQIPHDPRTKNTIYVSGSSSLESVKHRLYKSLIRERALTINATGSAIYKTLKAIVEVRKQIDAQTEVSLETSTVIAVDYEITEEKRTRTERNMSKITVGLKIVE